MASTERRRWHSDFSGQTRRDRLPCDYDVYLPDPLAGRRIVLDGNLAADVADAEQAITRLDVSATSLGDTEAIARLLLRAESIASSKIEGLEVGSRRLLRADAARDLGDDPRDVTALEVLGNIDAMLWAVEAVSEGTKISIDVILEVHRRLMDGTRLERYGGRIRTEQNWIGGSDFNPCGAAFVPPPPELVGDLLDDLTDFCNDDSLPAVAQAALAHAQFETIHPFIDGNGRTGRALIHLVLRRRGLSLRVLPPVSLVLATWSQDYIARLAGTRYTGSPDSDQARDGLGAWIGLFARACVRAVADASRFEERIRDLRQEWRWRLGPVRAGSAVELLIERLPGAPVVSTRSASELIGRSFQATNQAIDRLAEAGVLSQITVGRRNRAFEAPEVIEAFTELERQLASPAGDTRSSAPARRVPRRPEGRS